MQIDKYRILAVGLLLLIGISVFAQKKEPGKYWKVELLGALTNYSAYKKRDIEINFANQNIY